MSFVSRRRRHPPSPSSGAPSACSLHRIYYVGRNYAAPARKMGKDSAREAPFLEAVKVTLV